MHQNGWHSFDEGRSIGHVGTEKGIIMRDEEHGDGARITLERGGYTPFAITCGLYGWMMHTCFFSTEQSAQQAFEDMKRGLARLLALIPAETDPEADAKIGAVDDAIHAFVREFA